MVYAYQMSEHESKTSKRTPFAQSLIDYVKLNPNNSAELLIDGFMEHERTTRSGEPKRDYKILGFGKYKNKEISEILRMDKNYLVWLVSKHSNFISPETKAYTQELLK